MPTLLIVDDEKCQQEEIVREARSVGFREEEITLASSEQEASHLIEERSFQIAIVDVMLSDPPVREEGIHIISLLRERQPLCRTVGITMKVGTEAGVKCLEAGAHDFISSKWDFLPFGELLRKRLQLWKGVVERASSVSRKPAVPATVK